MTIIFEALIATAMIGLMMLLRHFAGHAAARRRSPCEQKGCNLGCGSGDFDNKLS